MLERCVVEEDESEQGANMVVFGLDTVVQRSSRLRLCCLERGYAAECMSRISFSGRQFIK